MFQEVAILTRRGSLLRGNVCDLQSFLMEKPEDVEAFGESTAILSPKTGVVFALESKVCNILFLYFCILHVFLMHFFTFFLQYKK